MQILGFAGAILFMIKIILHIWIKSAVERNYDPGQGQFLNFELIGPVSDDVPKDYKTLKLLTNTIYIIAILSFLIFLINYNIQ